MRMICNQNNLEDYLNCLEFNADTQQRELSRQLDNIEHTLLNSDSECLDALTKMRREHLTCTIISGSNQTIINDLDQKLKQSNQELQELQQLHQELQQSNQELQKLKIIPYQTELALFSFALNAILLIVLIASITNNKKKKFCKYCGGKLQ